MSTGGSLCDSDREELTEIVSRQFPQFTTSQLNTLIDWTGNLQPYCKLCHVRFTGPENALVHFSHDLCVSHFSRLLYIKRKFLGEIKIGCEICCCEVNTGEVLKIHENSPKHRKKVEARNFIMEMDKTYQFIKQCMKKYKSEHYTCSSISQVSEISSDAENVNNSIDEQEFTYNNGELLSKSLAPVLDNNEVEIKNILCNVNRDDISVKYKENKLSEPLMMAMDEKWSMEELKIITDNEI